MLRPPQFAFSVLLIIPLISPAYGQIGEQAGSEAGAPVTRPNTQAPAPKLTPQKEIPLLPAAFAGQPREGDIVDVPSAQGADAAHAAVLKEAGFAGASQARYGPWSVQVDRFEDATGAYSAFTFYRTPQMQPAHAGDDAAAAPGNGVFLARSGGSLVMVRPLSGHAAAPASSLAPSVAALLAALPPTVGTAAIPPPLPGLMPPAGLDRSTLHYAIGPAAYNGPVPARVIDFKRDAEAVSASYRLPGGKTAVLTLVMTPTPQIAMAQTRAIQSLPDPSLHVAVKRVGALTGDVSGAGVTEAEGMALLNRVRYRTTVTVNQTAGYTSEVAKAAQLLLTIAEMTGLLAAAALIVGFSLGFGRIFVRRLQGKPDSSLHDEQFTRLNL